MPATSSSSSSSSSAAAAKKHWWLTNKNIVNKYIKDAKSLIATHNQSDIASAINLLDAALAVSPRLETALELKARCLLYLRRFKDVADMLQDYIPSCKLQSSTSSSSDYSSLSDSSSQQLSRERTKLLHSSSDSSSSLAIDEEDGRNQRECSFKCFSVSDLKKKVLAGFCKNCDKEGQWRYLILCQACCHLGLMEDAIVLLQTGKRLATAAFRRQSICWSDDSFSLSETALISREIPGNNVPSSSTIASSESESVAHLLAHIKWLLRRRAAALAALDAGAHAEAIRHFTKILESRRSTPQAFLAECYIHRAGAYNSARRIADAISDCNRSLALDPASIPALTLRSQLLDSIRAYQDCLRDLEHLKLLYDAILRDRKLPGPAWKLHSVRYRDVSGNLRSLTGRIQEMRQRLGSGSARYDSASTVDYNALMGLRRGCTRSELERAHLLLTLRHRPDKSTSFVDRCEFMDDRDVDVVKDQARMSALLLYRLLQNGYASVMSAIMEEEAAEKQRRKAVAVAAVIQQPVASGAAPKREIAVNKEDESRVKRVVQAENGTTGRELPTPETTISASSAFQGVFCRDMAVVGNLLSQVGFNRPIPVKYEALSC